MIQPGTAFNSAVSLKEISKDISSAPTNTPTDTALAQSKRSLEVRRWSMHNHNDVLTLVAVWLLLSGDPSAKFGFPTHFSKIWFSDTLGKSRSISQQGVRHTLKQKWLTKE